MATVLGRSASTVSRELRRNATKAGGCRPFHAHRLARNRRARERPSTIAANAARSSDCAVLHCRVLAAGGTADPRVVLAVTALCGVRADSMGLFTGRSSPVRWCTTSSRESSFDGYAVRAAGVTSSAGSGVAWVPRDRARTSRPR
ncbi:hypothetical protein [Rhodococcus erythropolis]|uniref:hypothetical protein n=1 Tax=Rhodococcus erythropolis TaxID=1833 RepID=UPI003981DBF7